MAVSCDAENVVTAQTYAICATLGGVRWKEVGEKVSDGESKTNAAALDVTGTLPEHESILTETDRGSPPICEA